MHPIFMETLAAERVRDLRNEAIVSERAKLARRTRRAGWFLASTTARPGAVRTRRAAARHAG